MKKILFGLFSFALVFFLFAKTPVSATEKEYVNLIDPSKICYDETNDCYKLDQTISLAAKTYYTLFVSSSFLGDSDEDFYYEDHVFGATFTTASSTSEGLGTFMHNDTGLYFYEFYNTVDSTLVFTDLVTSGYTISTLPKNEIILFEGQYVDFKGFINGKMSSDYTKASSMTVYTEVSKPLSLDSIVSNIKAFDNNDGEVTVSKKSGTYDSTKLGENALVYEASDAAGNSQEFNLTIVVVDKTKPTITGDSHRFLPVQKDAPTDAEIKALFSVSDNYDTLTTNDLVIENSTINTFVSYKPASYTLTLKLADKSGNETSLDVTLEYYDTEPPVLEVQDVTVYLSSLSTDFFDSIVDEIIVKATDNSGKVKKSFIITSSDTSGGFAGVITFKITLEDTAKLKTSKTATVTIIDDIAPSFYVKGTMMNTTSDSPLTSDDIVAQVKMDLSSKGILYNDVILLGSNYNPNEVGEYEVKYLYSYNDSINYELGTIVVSEVETVTPVSNSSNLIYLVTLIPLAIALVAIIIGLRKKKVVR